MRYLRSFIFALCFVCVRGDEDYSFGELATDVGSGLAVAACEKDEKCSEMMPTITVVALLIAAISLCVCPPEPKPFNGRKTAKRVGAAGSGYLIGQSLF